MITVESLEKRVVELKAELEKYIQQANQNIAHTNGQIVAYQKLADDLKAEAAKDEAPTT